MMKLKPIFLESLEEFDDAPLPGMDNGLVLSLPHTNFVISVFPEDKRLMFTPQKQEELPRKIIEFVYAIKEYFNVSEIKEMDQNIFQIEFDPRQDFDKVMLFIQEQMDVDEEL